ncbi:hypothetical protein BJ138DRAFT_1154497 [Hygrophoropsis aurantiaca]|uniref:Uncharacterized protein n=1 Tax=Hygrophoropsis aurantiaca TaxID=72124 RepID=A0ACB8A8Z1_9AGAM|nr:hypothetical protein BJ138DRAFT_1154497 [Hygrophoropsis aurantiaca]
MAIPTPTTSPSSSMATRIFPRALKSEATCTADYSWMNNAEGQSPCLVVAYVEGACNGDDWTQPTLSVSAHYDPSSISNANACYCSWSSYNLLMACTLCQGPQFSDSLLTWAEFYKPACPSSYYDVYFPTGYTLDTSSSIPFWASMNPQNWTNAQFNVNQAQTIAENNYTDLTPGTTPSTAPQATSSPSLTVGAIVGIVLGCIAFILIVAAVVYLLFQKRKSKRQSMPSFIIGSVEDEASSMFPHSQWPSRPEYIPSTVGSPPPMSMQSFGQTLTQHPMQHFGQLYAPQPEYPSIAYSSIPPADAPTMYTSMSKPNAIPLV